MKSLLIGCFCNFFILKFEFLVFYIFMKLHKLVKIYLLVVWRLLQTFTQIIKKLYKIKKIKSCSFIFIQLHRIIIKDKLQETHTSSSSSLSESSSAWLPRASSGSHLKKSEKLTPALKITSWDWLLLSKLLSLNSGDKNTNTNSLCLKLLSCQKVFI